MPDIIIRRYSPADAPQWNELVAGSRNGLILHLRGYMDYHSDRFADHSLMAYAGNRLIAVLPANEVALARAAYRRGRDDGHNRGDGRIHA